MRSSAEYSITQELASSRTPKSCKAGFGGGGTGGMDTGSALDLPGEELKNCGSAAEPRQRVHRGRHPGRCRRQAESQDSGDHGSGHRQDGPGPAPAAEEQLWPRNQPPRRFRNIARLVEPNGLPILPDITAKALNSWPASHQ
jgi:hypothetical protein